MPLWRVAIDRELCLARGRTDIGPEELLKSRSLDDLLAGPAGRLEQVLEGPIEGPIPTGASVLVPIESQEVWAAGVTYARSREARRQESTVPDEYDLVYRAERPELFIKATPGRPRGPEQPIGIRADSPWNVPEPELGVVVAADGQIVAYVIGNDVSSRSIEGENPLYLPQAKIYTGSCALGPCLVPIGEAPNPSEMVISLAVLRGGKPAVQESTSVARMKRGPHELVKWLFQAMDFPIGVVLLTGTGIVPDPGFTLQAGDEVIVSISGLGELRNPVEVVGHR
ncbi:MAG: fumarylacetoacetate hydrolase family protein [Acidimicrobiia bacterium]